MKTTLKKIQLILADDHPLVREGIRSAIDDAEDIQLVAEATDGNEVQVVCQNHSFDVLLLDLNMPGPSARETVTFISEHYPKAAMIILSAYNDESIIKTLLGLGIRGYILKDEATEAVATAIRSVYQGGTWFSHGIIESLVKPHTQKGEHNEELSTRELEVLNLVKEGYTNKEIAGSLEISERTVRYHTENIIQKLRARNRLEAVARAIKNGWITP